jgi:ribosomal protein L7/L12
MNTEIELPVDVIAEIQANRKVAAIKLLRSHQSIGLKEAKEIVDAYIDAHPSNIRSSAQKSEGSFGRVLILALGVSVIYAIYRYVT